METSTIIGIIIVLSLLFIGFVGWRFTNSVQAMGRNAAAAMGGLDMSVEADPRFT